MSNSSPIVVSGGFDDIKSGDLRLLEEAAKQGELSVLLWPDETLRQQTGRAPKFSLAERSYFLNAVRYVRRVIPADPAGDFNALPENLKADLWADTAKTASAAREVGAAREVSTAGVRSPATAATVSAACECRRGCRQSHCQTGSTYRSKSCHDCFS